MQKREKETRKKVKVSQAKINLFLDIHNKRDDGFHEIETIIAPITLSDNLSFKLTDKSEVKVYCTSDSIKESDNIVYKIACFLKETYEVQNGVEIKLKKNIPLAAGLGGGSSNAAQTVNALNTLWKLNLTENEIHSIVKRFGSDINFFLSEHISHLGGRGERIIQMLPPISIEYILLVNPGIEISSKNAYSWVVSSSAEEQKKKVLVQALHDKDILKIAENLYNGLEPGVFAHFPIIQEIKIQMKEFGAIGSLMSGSGSTVFGIFTSRDSLDEARKYFKKYNYWFCETKIEEIDDL